MKLFFLSPYYSFFCPPCQEIIYTGSKFLQLAACLIKRQLNGNILRLFVAIDVCELHLSNSLVFSAIATSIKWYLVDYQLALGGMLICWITIWGVGLFFRYCFLSYYHLFIISLSRSKAGIWVFGQLKVYYSL